MSLIRKHVAVLQAWACLALVHRTNAQTFVRKDNLITEQIQICLCQSNSIMETEQSYLRASKCFVTRRIHAALLARDASSAKRDIATLQWCENY